jgi:hypothetical protein
MGRYGRMILVFLFVLNILFVYMGYAGIAKIERYGEPPFHGSSMMTVVYNAHFIPNDVILFWYSGWGKLVIWSGSILLPVAAVYVLLVKEKLLAGLLILSLSVIPFGVVGFFIWLHAFCDLPHEW